MLHRNLVYLAITKGSPYLPDSPLGPATGINRMHYNTVLVSTLYVKIAAPKMYLGQQCELKIQYLDQHHAVLIQELLIKNSITTGTNGKTWGKNTVLHSTENYVGNDLKIFQEVDQSCTQ